MSKNKAVLETVIISVLIPLFLWTCARLTRFGMGGILFFSFIGLCFAYYYFIFSRHKHLGKLFVFLTAVLSTLLQIVMTVVEIAGLGPIFGGDEGHPNGDAILVLIVLVMQPVLYDIGCIFIWIGSKIICFFSQDNGEPPEEEEDRR
ncbi:MAG: hypothetical protein IK078_12475 [Lachnospiraceae bacterium]|nr:hypothetical protein [Lachnospiraceae bacterium]